MSISNAELNGGAPRYSFPPTATAIVITPTANLRWNHGKLQQSWHGNDGYQFIAEWRDVPTEEESPKPEAQRWSRESIHQAVATLVADVARRQSAGETIMGMHEADTFCERYIDGLNL